MRTPKLAARGGAARLGRCVGGTRWDGRFYAVDARSGQQRWMFQGGVDALLWEFQTEASRANRGWVLTADKRFNGPMLYPSTWHEATDLAQDRQASVGSFFSTPLVANAVVYVGSADGNLYAIE